MHRHSWYLEASLSQFLVPQPICLVQKDVLFDAPLRPSRIPADATGSALRRNGGITTVSWQTTRDAWRARLSRRSAAGTGDAGRDAGVEAGGSGAGTTLTRNGNPRLKAWARWRGSGWQGRGGQFDAVVGKVEGHFLAEIVDFDGLGFFINGDDFDLVLALAFTEREVVFLWLDRRVARPGVLAGGGGL